MSELTKNRRQALLKATSYKNFESTSTSNELLAMWLLSKLQIFPVQSTGKADLNLAILADFD